MKVNNSSPFLKHYFDAVFIHIRDIFDNKGVFNLDTIVNQNIKTNFIDLVYEITADR